MRAWCYLRPGFPAPSIDVAYHAQDSDTIEMGSSSTTRLLTPRPPWLRQLPGPLLIGTKRKMLLVYCSLLHSAADLNDIPMDLQPDVELTIAPQRDPRAMTPPNLGLRYRPNFSSIIHKGTFDIAYWNSWGTMSPPPMVH